MWDDLWKNLHEKFHERMEEMQKSRGLRIWILHILDEHGPRNGVEIMDSVQNHYESFKMAHDAYRHHGRHEHRRGQECSKRPSPGSIYPMLKKMVEEGLISKRDDGRYELTEKGQKVLYRIFGHLNRWHDGQADRGSFILENALTEINGYISYLEDVKKEKLIPHEEMIGELSKRLEKIKESLKEEESQVNID